MPAAASASGSQRRMSIPTVRSSSGLGFGAPCARESRRLLFPDLPSPTRTILTMSILEAPERTSAMKVTMSAAAVRSRSKCPGRNARKPRHPADERVQRRERPQTLRQRCQTLAPRQIERVQRRERPQTLRQRCQTLHPDRSSVCSAVSDPKLSGSAVRPSHPDRLSVCSAVSDPKLSGSAVRPCTQTDRACAAP